MTTSASIVPGPDEADRSRYPQQLARALGMGENILITLSAVTPASSVFIIIPVSVFVGLCYAELATAYPIAGGEYTWVARLLGRPNGFAVFGLTLVNGCSSSRSSHWGPATRTLGLVVLICRGRRPDVRKS
ncbi:amino acid permease [Nocardia acididurans]|uniref:amino acid permease n=1 Tax=Nocardia acididurans TaxID=2802282 RepID=UPI001E59030E|nr:amino acid permease [Nocardia acididurans]